jgi:hypothetical protein
MDSRHRHNITWAEAGSDTDEFAHQAYAGPEADATAQAAFSQRLDCN